MRTLTPAFAATHEALYPRLDALARQAEAVAARKPDADVPDVTRAAAETLLFDVGRFAGRRALAPAQLPASSRPPSSR